VSRPQHVLVVDDNDAVRALLAAALRGRGFVVLEASSGAAALRLAYEDPPALAIVDQWMPGMTGAELVRLLKAAPRAELRELPVIGLSSRAGSEEDLRGAGASVFLRKPFGEADLVTAVRSALGAVTFVGGVRR
jgi:CheY-like chemotaxis protein